MVFSMVFGGFFDPIFGPVAKSFSNTMLIFCRKMSKFLASWSSMYLVGGTKGDV